jgi:hypothetical protein
MTDSAADALFREWIGYGSYVDEARRLVYIETPKAGCSSVKHLLRDLIEPRPLQFNPTANQTRLAMMIHDRGQIPLPTLNSFSGARLDDILQGDGWFRFCAVRNPFERFFSAWCEKIFLCEPGYETYLPGPEARHVEFADFYRRVTTRENPLTCDSHWRAQTALLRPDALAYSRIYDVRDLAELPGDLARHFAAIGLDATVPELRRVNEGFSVPSDGFVTPEVLAGLRAFYHADFERFAFSEPKLAWAPERRAAELVNGFTDAIFERNRLIKAHHDWLKQAMARG